MKTVFPEKCLTFNQWSAHVKKSLTNIKANNNEADKKRQEGTRINA